MLEDCREGKAEGQDELPPAEWEAESLTEGSVLGFEDC